jgi:O-antigen/teichoic acid export membrane protein
VKAIIPGTRVILPRWSKAAFVEMWQYGFNFQITTLLVILSDPLTKYLVAKFGSLGQLGNFEMAYRATQKVRELAVGAMRVSVPYFSALSATNSGEIEPTYRSWLTFSTATAFTLFPGLICLSPTISIIWLGYLSQDFVLTMTISGVGYMFNTLSVPAYFALVGSGKLKQIIVAHVIQASLNAVLGTIFGLSFGFNGVLFGLLVSLTFSNIPMLIYFHRSLEKSTAFSPSLRLACIAILALSSSLAAASSDPNGGTYIGLVAVVCLTSGCLFWTEFLPWVNHTRISQIKAEST